MAQAGQWTSETLPGGVDDALCDALLKRLNALGEQCAEDALETYPGFSEAPWENLNPKEHEDLVAKLLRYWQVGPRRYFDLSASRSTSEDAAYLRKAHELAAAGGTLQVWRTRLVPTFYGKPATAGQQTIVLLESHVPLAISKECPGKRSKGWIPTLFLVTPDLSGPDPAIDPGNASILLSRTVRLHDGIPHLVNADTVFRGFGDAGLQGLCSYKYVEVNKEDDK
jgi:hypothetical protein